MNIHRYEHTMICGATAPGIVLGVDHEHECHQPARRPDQTVGVVQHTCHLCPVTWTEQTTNRMTLRPVDTSWVTTEADRPAWPLWRGIAFVFGIPAVCFAAIVAIAWLVTR